MPKFLVKEESYINGAIVQPGDVIDYDPPEGTTISGNLEPVKGKRATQASAPVDGETDQQ